MGKNKETDLYKNRNDLWDSMLARSGIREKFRVRFSCVEDDRYPFEAEFICYGRDHVENTVRALGAFNAGDECRCTINGHFVELDHNNELPEGWVNMIGCPNFIRALELGRRGDLF